MGRWTEFDYSKNNLEQLKAIITILYMYLSDLSFVRYFYKLYKWETCECFKTYLALLAV